MLRVGRIRYENGRPVYPSYKGFTPVIVMTPSSEYGSLSPYSLKDEQGQIMENIWQFSKVYESVPATVQYYSRWDRIVIWNHPAEQHVDEKGCLTKEYWNWRQKGFRNPYAVRYPVGLQHRFSCLYSFLSNEKEQLNYVQSREKIYLPLYSRLVQKEPQYKELKHRLERGENLLLLEVDGPHEESLPYYRETYGLDKDFIEGSTIEVTEDNMHIMLNDTKHPFGHGYCLGLVLAGF